MNPIRDRARSAEQVKDALRRNAGQSVWKQMSRGQHGLVVALLNKYLGGDVNRRLVLSWLFKDGKHPMSTKDLTNNWEWWTLWDWIDPIKLEGREYAVSATFPLEAANVLVAAATLFAKLSNQERAETSESEQISPILAISVELGGTITGIEPSEKDMMKLDDEAKKLEDEKNKSLIGKTKLSDMLDRGILHDNII